MLFTCEATPDISLRCKGAPASLFSEAKYTNG